MRAPLRRARRPCRRSGRGARPGCRRVSRSRSRTNTLATCGRLARVGLLILCPSPLTRAAAWGGLPGELEQRGHTVAVLDPTSDDDPPYAARCIATCAQLA